MFTVLCDVLGKRSDANLQPENVTNQQHISRYLQQKALMKEKYKEVIKKALTEKFVHGE